MAMEFPKSCQTNVRRIDEVLSLSHTRLTSIGTTDHSASVELLTQLRAEGILCTLQRSDVHIFNTTEANSFEHPGFKVEEQDFIKEHADQESITDLLNTAIEEGIAFRLAARGDTYRLGFGNWLSLDVLGSGGIWTRLDTHVLADSAISITTISRRVQLGPYEGDSGVVEQILLSPFGIAAVTAGEYAQNDINDIELEWRKNLLQILATLGCTVSDKEAWIKLQHPDHTKTVFTWPRRFCLSSRRPESMASADSNVTDSLSFAEQWAESANERQQALLFDQHARGLPGSLNANPDETDLTASPPFLFRTDLSNAIYPTPEDIMTTSTSTQLMTQDQTLQATSSGIQDGADLFRMQTHDDDGNGRPREYSIASSMAMDVQKPGSHELYASGDGVLDGEVDEDDFDFFDDETSRNMLAQSEQHFDDVAEALHIQDAETLRHDEISDTVMLDSATTPNQAQESVPVSTTASPRLSSDHALQPATKPSHLSRPKPLSPFDIRERLLPPPVPVSQWSAASSGRRKSTFAAIVFNPGLRLDKHLKSHNSAIPKSNVRSSRKTTETWRNSDSDDDSDSSDIDTARIPTLPWRGSSGKRKRNASVDDNAALWNVRSEKNHEDGIHLDAFALLDDFANRPRPDIAGFVDGKGEQKRSGREAAIMSTGTGKDLLMIAQLLSEQAATCTTQLMAKTEAHDSESKHNHDADKAIKEALLHFLPNTKCLDLGSLTLMRAVQKSNQFTKGQSRPPERSDAATTAELYTIPTPYLCFKRADDNIEVLPTATHFWEALSLAPANGGKDIQPHFLFPGSGHLYDRMEGFFDDLKSIYEGCKLGLVHGTTESSFLRLQGSVSVTSAELLKDYKALCQDLLEKLAEEAFSEVEATYVIVLLDPFNGKDTTFIHGLAGCFLSTTRRYKSRAAHAAQSRIARDICLQILPTALVCSADTVPFLTSNQMALIAREIYDRCPMVKTTPTSSPLSIDMAPSVMLAESPPKRIGFQLTSSVPTDLLHEGSELQVAYAKSLDGMWVTTVWSDNTGRSQKTASFCLRGSSYAAVFTEIWSRTLDVINVRAVSWRVSIATQDVLHEVELDCWREVLSSPLQRKGGALHVSIVLVDTSPALRVKQMVDSEIVAPSQATVITPVSTPQASAFTASPDALGQTAPPTPAPTEPGNEDGEPAHLVDLPDETWAVLLDTKYDLTRNSDTYKSRLAQGVLLKHGDKDSREDVPLIGVNVAFTLRVRGNGSAVEDASLKPVEILLRELLSAYRGLGLLAKIRGVEQEGAEGLPIHIISATKGAQALDGLLRSRSD